LRGWASSFVAGLRRLRPTRELPDGKPASSRKPTGECGDQRLWRMAKRIANATA
jgi:hypothetical protein